MRFLFLLRVLLCICFGLLSFSTAANVFFKVTHEQRDQTAYVLGTMHLLCKDSFVMPDTVYQALANSEQLIVEVNLTNDAELEAAQSAMFQQPRNYLQRYLNSEQYSQLEHQTQRQLGRPLSSLAPLRPLIISSLFLADYLPCESETFSVDEAIIEHAVSKDTLVIGLESAKWQLELFDQVDLSEQVSALYELVTEKEVAQHELISMADTYLSGNGKKLHEVMLAQDDFIGASALFLDQRNQTWVQKLPQLFVGKRSFVAVGAGHLYGDQGLLSLLIAQGYEITPIPVSFGAVESH